MARPVTQVLLEHAEQSNEIRVCFHSPQALGRAMAALKGFYGATLDEARLQFANQYAEEVLRHPDIHEMHYFRTAVTRREMSGDIDYLRQRDHAAHTVNNFILGWYIFEQTKLRDHMETAIAEKESSFSQPMDPTSMFRYLWPFTSLLHDIGYLLEGSLSALNTEVQNLRVERGAETIHDFFNSYFWQETELDSMTARDYVHKTTSISFPDFRNKSLFGLADLLCSVGDCELIRKYTAKELNPQSPFSIPALARPQGLSMDAFDLWHDHYWGYRKRGMSKRVKLARKVYQNLIWRGRPESGLRMLDHGVCSGLLSLLYCTLLLRISVLLPHAHIIVVLVRRWHKHVEVKSEADEHLEDDALVKWMEWIFSIIAIMRKEHSRSEVREEVINVAEFMRITQEGFTAFVAANDLSESTAKHLYSFISAIEAAEMEKFLTLLDNIVTFSEKDEGNRLDSVLVFRTIAYMFVTLLPDPLVWNIHYWWTGILWATAATALHNAQQELGDGRLSDNQLSKDHDPIRLPVLRVDEDPLAYLGILVDILQEWDRYSSIPDSAFTANTPCQGSDVLV
jgi:hypothetical protein